MGQRVRTVVYILAVLRIVLSLFPIALLGGSGWELLALIIAVPGILSGILLLISGRRIDDRPRAAVVCFLLAAVLGAVANEAGIAFGGTFGVLVSLLMSGAFVLVPLILAAIISRTHLKAQGMTPGGAAKGS